MGMVGPTLLEISDFGCPAYGLDTTCPSTPYSLPIVGSEQGEKACINPTRANDPKGMHSICRPHGLSAPEGFTDPSPMATVRILHCSSIVGFVNTMHAQPTPSIDIDSTLRVGLKGGGIGSQINGLKPFFQPSRYWFLGRHLSMHPGTGLTHPRGGVADIP